MSRAHVVQPGPGSSRGARRARPDADERAHLAHGVGRVLFAERLTTGMTVDQVAAAAPLHPSTVWRIEAGTARPSQCSLFRLARALRPDHDREGVAALFVELEAVAGSSVYCSPSWRPRLRWRRLIDRARAQRFDAGSRGSEAREPAGGPSVRRGGGSSPLSASGGPLDIVTEPMREALRRMRERP